MCMNFTFVSSYRDNKEHDTLYTYFILLYVFLLLNRNFYSFQVYFILKLEASFLYVSWQDTKKINYWFLYCCQIHQNGLPQYRWLLQIKDVLNIVNIMPISKQLPQYTCGHIFRRFCNSSLWSTFCSRQKVIFHQ